MLTPANPGKTPDAQAPAAHLEAEIRSEQTVVDRAYRALDHLREFYRAEQRRVAADSKTSNPGARSDRDAFAAHYGESAATLEAVEDRLVFGRLDNEDGSVNYIGRVALREEEAGEGAPAGGGRTNRHHQLLMDWRAPASRAFYQATAANPQGVVRRRHLSTRQRRVTQIEDELFDLSSPLASTSLQGEGALMAALGAARSGQMRDIVSTIQAEQDEIIRADLAQFLVVQGGPGTGKTAVALHRAAYLLYQHRQQLARSGVLVVGPSRVFLRYIEKVLPALGETGVVSTTLADCFPSVRPRRSDRAEVAALKRAMAWVDICRRAVRDLQRPLRQPVALRVESRTIYLTEEIVAKARERARHSHAKHNVAWETFAKTCLRELLLQYAQGETDPDALAWMRADLRESLDVRRAINLCWLPATPTQLLERIYAYPELLQRLAPEFSPEQRRLLYRPKGQEWTVEDVPILDELAEDLGPLRTGAEARAAAAERQRQAAELAAAEQAIAAQGLGGGLVTAKMLAERAGQSQAQLSLSDRAKSDRSWTYGHVVVDEAQELSPLAWNMLLRRCPSRSFTVVGDLDQYSGPTSPASWNEALGPAARTNPRTMALTVNYRTPREIMEAAKATLAAGGHPVAYEIRSARSVPGCLHFSRLESLQSIFPPAKPGSSVTSPAEGELTDLLTTSGLADALQDLVAAELDFLDRELGAGNGTLSVIVPSQPAAWAQALGLPAGDPVMDRLSIIGAVASKGLEFDSVLLVEPSQIWQGAPGDLYVAMTRPTRRLHVVWGAQLPAGMGA